MKPWWEKYPEILEKEEAELKKAGIDYQIIRNKQKQGILTIDLVFQDKGMESALRLSVFFPDLFPYFRPEIIAPDLSLPRHQNPIEKHLCLLGRATKNWRPSFSVAWLLEIIPELLSIAYETNPEKIKGREEPQGEPVSYYYPYLPSAAFKIDSSWKIDPNIQQGTFEARCLFGVGDDGLPYPRGIISLIKDNDGTILETWKGNVPESYRILIKGPWYRFEKAPIKSNQSELMEILESKDITLLKQIGVKIGKKLFVKYAAVIFPEEHRQFEMGDGWLFVSKYLTKQRRKRDRFAFVKAYRGGEVDMGARVPARKAFSGKKIAVFGAGAIGGALIIDLARNGASTICIVDHDDVEPGPTVRWPLGEEYVGMKKVHALDRFISNNYPEITIVPYVERIGQVRLDHTKQSQADIISEIFSNCHLVIDATSEDGVHKLLSDECKKAKIPLVLSYATPGAWGGVVARILPSADKGCWYCLMRRFNDNKDPINSPPQESEENNIQPAGCADPTFRGASFDLNEVTMETLRLVAGTLSSLDDQYPDVSWDVAVLELRENGQRIPPRWTTYELPYHSECSCKES